MHADTVLIDESLGRHIALSLGLKTVGVLSLLVSAKRLHHVDRVEPLLETLAQRISFRISPSLRKRILNDAGETG